MPRGTSVWDETRFQDRLWTPELSRDTEFFFDIKDLGWHPPGSLRDRSRYKRNVTIGGTGLGYQNTGTPYRRDGGSSLYNNSFGNAENAAISTISTTSFTACAVFWSQSVSYNNRRVFSLQGSGTSAIIWIGENGNAGFLRTNAASDATPTQGAFFLGQWAIASLTWDGSNVTHRINGANAVTVANSGAVSGLDYLGVTCNAGGGFMYGGIAGVCFMQNSKHRELLEGFMAWRYGFENLLMRSGHKWACKPPSRGDAF